MEKMFLDHVLVLWSVNQRVAWREKVEDYLRNRLVNVPVLKFTDKLVIHSFGEIFVFVSKPPIVLHYFKQETDIVVKKCR